MTVSHYRKLLPEAVDVRRARKMCELSSFESILTLAIEGEKEEGGRADNGLGQLTLNAPTTNLLIHFPLLSDRRSLALRMKLFLPFSEGDVLHPNHPLARRTMSLHWTQAASPYPNFLFPFTILI